uniref:Brevican n=1 Tax=Xiphophorus couchianus TaxID=32473 RepID=A0A3B5MSV2_9TELE
ILVPLGSSISIPCFVSLSSSSSPPVVPRVKWTVVSGGIETQILVARSSRVKINEAYRDRVALLNYTSSPEDASLWLGDLRHSDSGHYRCEVQQGLEDASKVVQVKVKGVVFHYRDALGRYSFSFQQAQRACEGIGAQVATPDQLLAAYFDGYEQCDAGWLADQSVRYPIQVPREGCYGDMDGQPGVRNYGTMDPDDLFDVYCYIEQIHGKVFYDPVPQQLSFDEAQSYCGAAGAQLATTAQLYSAWSEGLDRCSPGWLSDGSVRYPIVIPRERCGGPQAGVKTLYRFSNQTGFPEPSALHDVYCFKGRLDNLITEAKNLQQNVVILEEREQEIHLNQLEKQVEREAQSELESLPLLPDSFTTEDPLDGNQTVTSDRAESFPTTTYALDFLKPLNESTEIRYDSQHLPETAVSTISTTKTFDSTQSTTTPPGDYNGTDLHQNLSFTFHTSEFEISTYEPQMENQTASDTNSTEYLQSTEQTIQYQEIHETSLDKSHTNYSETKNNRTDVDVEKAFWEGTTLAICGFYFNIDLQSLSCVSDACLDDPCLNGGTCTERDGRIKCLCLPTYGGRFCQNLERCEPGWDKFHGFCYRHFSQRQSWEVAERHCRTQGAHLVSIMTPEEQDYINSRVMIEMPLFSNSNLFSKSIQLYENWYRGQPDSYFLSGEDCVVMVWHDSGRWSDVPCNYHLAYTCKKGTSSCGPPPKVRNASIFGKTRVRYETNAVVRYRCSEGFQQRRNPVVRCLSGGRWERPHILCIPGEIGAYSINIPNYSF